MIYVFTGNGKGKTTSALGMGMRAAGAGRRVLMVQFLKDGSSSEIKAIRNIKNFQVKSFGRSGFGQYSEKDCQLAKAGFNFVWRAAELSSLPKFRRAGKKFELLILDEISLVLKFRMLKSREVIAFLSKYGKSLDIALTGRHCPKKIIKMADLVTEFKEIKHYFKRARSLSGGRFKARKGIEF